MLCHILTIECYLIQHTHMRLGSSLLTCSWTARKIMTGSLAGNCRRFLNGNLGENYGAKDQRTAPELCIG